MERLGFGKEKMLEISSFDVLKNNIFYIQLRNKKTKEIIISEEMGYHFKTGVQLSLKESYNLICEKKTQSLIHA